MSVVYEEIQELQRNIIHQINAYDYLCVDDYLKQCRFEGDISLIKEYLKNIFRSEQILDKDKIHAYKNKFLKAKKNYEQLQNTNIKMKLDDIEIAMSSVSLQIKQKEEELNTNLQELELAKNEISFNKAILNEHSDELNYLFKNASESKIMYIQAESLKVSLEQISRKVTDLTDRVKSLTAVIVKLDFEVSELRKTYMKLCEEEAFIIHETAFDEQRAKEEFYNVRSELKNYLVFQIYEDKKLYVYNVLKYSIEIVKGPKILQDTLKKFRKENFNINNTYTTMISRIEQERNSLEKFIKKIEKRKYSESMDYWSRNIIQIVYDFVQSYNLNKLYEMLDNDENMDFTLYYRGQSNSNFLPIPGIFRNEKSLKNEHVMYHEINVKCPNEVQNTFSHLEVLATMQHYSLPTRLLDITSSPLTATFFAIEDVNNIHMDCELIVSRVANEDIKYYDSDTIEILSAIATLKYKEKQELWFEAVKSILNLMKDSSSAMEVERNLESILEKFNQKSIVQKLNNEIKKEWRTELKDINPLDILRICFVKPKQNNNRIIRQQGAFIVSGLMKAERNIEAFDNYRISIDKNIDYLNNLNDLLGKEVQDEYEEIDWNNSYVKPRIIIPESKKKEFKQWLLDLGIDETSIYPEFEKVAGYLKAKYS